MVEANAAMTIHEFQKNTILCPHALPLEDFFVLLGFVTKQTKTFILAHPEYTLSPSKETELSHLIQRRLTHEPVAYLTGQKEFYGYTFLVNKDVLIPRPETEVLIEEVLSYIKNTTLPLTLLDIGTGSGAIILTLAEELRSTETLFRFIGVDISTEALHVAMENKKQLKNNTVSFQESDLLLNISFSQKEHLCIIANLPYLPTFMYESTEPDVKNFEPMLALVSGSDGLNHYRKLIEQIQSIPLISFTLFVEIDPSQTQVLLSLFMVFSYSKIRVIKDLTGRERFIQVSVS